MSLNYIPFDWRSRGLFVVPPPRRALHRRSEPNPDNIPAAHPPHLRLLRCRDGRRSPGPGEYRSCFFCGLPLVRGSNVGIPSFWLVYLLVWCLCIYTVAWHLYSMYITCIRVCALASYRSSCVCWLDWFPPGSLVPGPGTAERAPLVLAEYPPSQPILDGGGISRRPPKSYPLQFFREGVCLC